MKKILERFREIFRRKATHIVEYELNESENIFFFLLIGFFSGIPSPPSYLTYRILPFVMEDIERIRKRRIKEKTDIISELFGILEIG